jgi:ubiquinone biosynthesis protein UbiJ
MAESPFNWKQPAGRALETALNRALALDVDTRAGLAALAGKRLTLSLTSPPLALQVRVEGERLAVGPVDDVSEPHLAVRSSLAGLLAQWSFLRREDVAPVGKLHVAGDADLARRLQRLAENFDPDWQQPFVAVFGDVLGVQMANAVAGALRQARSAAADLAATAAEFVTEETRDVVSKPELNAFHEDVDAVRDAVERIAARVARLRVQAGLQG